MKHYKDLVFVTGPENISKDISEVTTDDLKKSPYIEIDNEVVDSVLVYHTMYVANAYADITGKKESIVTDEILNYFDKYYDVLPDSLQESIKFLREH
jgi:hypothetical protein